MSAITITASGEKCGQCIEACDHRDCRAHREDAAKACIYCGSPLGYERFVYTGHHDGKPCHETRLLDAVEQKRKGLAASEW